MFGESTAESCSHDRGSVATRYVIGSLALLCTGAIAQPPRIAVIGREGFVEPWCEVVASVGYDCDALFDTDPIGSISQYLVVIDISTRWTDPDGILGNHIRAGRTVITWGSIPTVLGINTDPIVQDWIGANSFAEGTNQMLTVATDPILGDLPVGTVLIGFNASLFSALDDTTGHPGAKVLARYHGGTGKIGLMRNDWEGGTSVYFSGPIWPNNPLDKAIILSTVRELAPLPIPTVSQWGLTAAALLLVTAGSILIQRRRIRIA